MVGASGVSNILGQMSSVPGDRPQEEQTFPQGFAYFSSLTHAKVGRSEAKRGQEKKELTTLILKVC